MRLRTETDISPSTDPIEMTERLVSLGSCFSHAIGSRLSDGGVDIAVTPMGILFNPVSIANLVRRAVKGQPYTADDLYRDERGVYHALDFESRRQGVDPAKLLADINADFEHFARRLNGADRWLVTFGTAWCFDHLPTQKTVGNCHKLPDGEFRRRLCSVDDIVSLWAPLIEEAPKVVFTVSPVRHLNDGLHGNTLSKSILHLAVERLCRQFPNASYFPAYEALVDDLRDYRFYADDLKHPSTMAEEYIFELFSRHFFNERTRQIIEKNRKLALSKRHRPIL